MAGPDQHSRPMWIPGMTFGELMPLRPLRWMRGRGLSCVAVRYVLRQVVFDLISVEHDEFTTGC